MKVTDFSRCVFAFMFWFCGALVPAAMEVIARIFAEPMGWECYEHPVGLIWSAALLTAVFGLLGSWVSG